MQKVALMRCDCVSVCMCFSSVSTSVEYRRTHQSCDLRFHFPHPKFTSKRAKRRMVDEEEQQQLEAHDTEKSYQHARAPARLLPTTENRASALAGVARTAVAAVAKVSHRDLTNFKPEKGFRNKNITLRSSYFDFDWRLFWLEFSDQHVSQPKKHGQPRL